MLASSSDLSTLTVTVTERDDPVVAVEERSQSGLSRAVGEARDGFTSGVEGLVARSGRAALCCSASAACCWSPGSAGGWRGADSCRPRLGSGRVGRRIGVMGGTFDPVHNGHLSAAQEVAAGYALDEVVFVPTGQPWQKSDRAVSLAEDRYLMTVIATASNPRFTVSRTDVDRPGPTYTIDTLRALRRTYEDAELFFITGADALAQILGWHAAEELFALAHFVGVSRPGYEPVDLAAFPDGAVTLLEVPALAISSSAVRERVAQGVPVWYLVPDGVVQYIDKRGLYRPEGARP